MAAMTAAAAASRGRGFAGSRRGARGRARSRSRRGSRTGSGSARRSRNGAAATVVAIAMEQAAAEETAAAAATIAAAAARRSHRSASRSARRHGYALAAAIVVTTAFNRVRTTAHRHHQHNAIHFSILQTTLDRLPRNVRGNNILAFRRMGSSGQASRPSKQKTPGPASAVLAVFQS